MIEALSGKLVDQESRKPASRIDALTSFIWGRFLVNTVNITGLRDDKLYVMCHAVNLRPRFDPLLSHLCFESIIHLAFSCPVRISKETCNVYGLSTREVRKEKHKIENECVKGLQEGAEQSVIPMNENSAKLMEVEVVALLFSSYCRFPAYDNDFGWGRPKWAFSAPLRCKNTINFLDTKEGDGIEAFLNLEKPLMDAFESDDELFGLCMRLQVRLK